MNQITLTIDGQTVTVPQGTTVLKAAQKAGIYIPALCHHDDLAPYGACRLCIVEIEGMRGLPTSCTTTAAEGMVVKTESVEIDKIRRNIVELIMADHIGDCLSCASNQRCDLQKICAYMGIDTFRLPRKTDILPPDESNPFFIRDLNKCVMCAKCVRTCAEIVGVHAIDMINRGYDSKPGTFNDMPLKESRCMSCGECMVRCPVGALSPREWVPPTREVKSICPYCGVGCGIYLGIRLGRVVGVRGDPESPVNQGSLCVKGRFGSYEFIHHAERLTRPLIRENGQFREAGWDEALELVASTFQQYKGDAFAALSSAKCTNEDNYLMQKFTRAVMGTNNIDHCARL